MTSMGEAGLVSVRVMVTSSISMGARLRVPLKITSSIFSPRKDLALCSPSTHAMASETLLLPQPFGPTIAVTPASCTTISPRSENDLKPSISIRLSFNTSVPSSPFRLCRLASVARVTDWVPIRNNGAPMNEMHDRNEKPDRIILHVDMDAFYASIEQLDDQSLKGRPVIVGADPRQGLGRGVVAACSYEARKFGVRSALPISRAWKLCPEGAFVRPRMERYVEVSHEVMEILRRFTNLVEPLSIDEAFLDVTGSTTLFGAPLQIARAVKKQIREATGLTASAGVAPNKFLAKIASDLKKPDGLVVVEQGEVETFLADLPISRLWGVGPKTAERLYEMGLRTIGAIRARKQEDLMHALGGSLGMHLHELAVGHDERPVVPNWEPTSVSKGT